MGSIVLTIIGIQAVCIVTVILVLWFVLQKRLLSLAVKDFSYYAPAEGEPKSTSVQVITHKTISPAHREEIRVIVQKRLGANIQAVYQVEKDLLGGMIIKVNQRTYDYSLRDRLKKSGFLK